MCESETRYRVRPIGQVRRDDEEFPGGRCTLQVRPDLADALLGLEPGDHLQVLWWMHRLEEEGREVLQCHPMGDRSRPKRGVFALRSPVRPNPIGVEVVEVLERRDDVLVTEGFDAYDGSPIVDLKIAKNRDD